jgi:Bacterial Ig-like domain
VQLGGLAVLTVTFLAACARIEPPPGGPPDSDPPALVATRPESLDVYPEFRGQVEFFFDEVVSEGGQPSMGLGTSDLERLILLSPSDNVPRVSWKRSVIGVEPKEGWRPNTVYRVELLPGVFDLQRNQLDSGTVITFTTGAALPRALMRGQVIDWPAGRLAQAALVEAILLPDSLRYKVITDSSGSYSLGPVPGGEYLVYGVIDQNRNRRRDLRDSFDTVRVRVDSTAIVAPVWAIPHDTVGPRLQNLALIDSLAADMAFNQPLDPHQQLDTTNVRVLQLPDSTPVVVTSLLPRARDDSIQRALRQAADTLARPDSIPLPRPDTVRTVLSTRPALFDHLLVRVATPFTPGRQYVIESRGVRNVTGAAADSRQLLTVPERPPTRADSLIAPLDSTPPDSTPPRR